jgi:hypothetical protein
MTHDSKVIIHGAEWQRSDLEKALRACSGRPWSRERWWPRDSLISRDGVAHRYSGQGYDPSYFRVERGTWNHDHCEICGWELRESDDEELSVGYVDGSDWICSECYHQFIQTSDDNAAS